MHVKTKRIAFLGLLLAIAMILVLLGAYIEPSTLFFLAAAAFCTGIAVRECGRFMGGAFFAASLILGFFLSPNKLHMITFGAMSLYVYIREAVFEKIGSIQKLKHRMAWFWICKYVLFNILFLPILFLLPGLIYTGEITLPVRIAILLAGEVLLFLYDKAYEYFQLTIWNRLRRNLPLLEN